MSDDIEDYWKDVVPPRSPAEEEKPVTLGYLWIGLLSGFGEPFDRRLIRVPDGQMLEFEAEFRNLQEDVGVRGKEVSISGGALWLAKRGGKPVYAKQFDEVKTLRPGDAITFKIVIADSGNEYVSFRKLLQIYGVL